MADRAPLFRPEATVCINCRAYRAIEEARGECTEPDAQPAVMDFNTGQRVWQKVHAGESCLLWQPIGRKVQHV